MCISGMRSAFVSPMAEMSVEFVEVRGGRAQCVCFGCGQGRA
jgi:hypothetical protein